MSKNLEIGIAHAEPPTKYDDETTYKTAKNIVSQAIKQVKKPKFGVLFCSAKFNVKEIARGAQESFKSIPWIGCTTAGEFTNERVTQGGCAVMVLGSDYIHVGIGVEATVSKDPRTAGKKAVLQALRDVKLDQYIDPYVQYLTVKKKNPEELVRIRPYGIMTLMPGATMNNLGHEDEVLQGIIDIVGPDIPITGGSAGDDAQFKQTYQFVNGKTYTDAVITIVYVSNLKIGYSIQHGYKPTGKIASVTEADGKIVKTLNGKPAAEVYAEMLGVKIDELKKNIIPYIAKYPFGFPDIFGNFWVRNPQAVIENNALLFFAPVPKNSILALMTGTDEDIIKAAEIAVKKEAEDGKIKKAGLGVVFGCAGRCYRLQNKIVDEWKLLKKTFGETPFIGFYTYAEHASLPYGGIGPNNQTLVSFMVGDELITQ